MGWSIVESRGVQTVVTFAAGILPCAVLIASAAVAPSGSLCVDLAAARPPQTSAPGLQCASGDSSFQVDARAVLAWPRTARLRVEGLDTAAQHRVRIFCGGKPHQTFTFRFSEYRENELCLFINGLYQTAQLWRPRDARWCKCR